MVATFVATYRRDMLNMKIGERKGKRKGRKEIEMRTNRRGKRKE